MCFLSIILGKSQNDRRTKNQLDSVSSTLQSVISPVAVGVGNLVDSTSDFTSGLFSARRIVEENRALKAQLAGTSMYTEQVEQLVSQVDLLRRLQGIPTGPGLKFTATEIIGFLPYENRITLGAGKAEQIRAGMPVVCADGLVGIVQVVDTHRCQALLLASPSLKIGAMAIGHSPPPAGLLQGISASQLSFVLFDPKAPIKVGDTIVTSGYGERIPRGLIVGKIVQVDDDEEYGTRRAQIDPAVSIGSIKEVKVLR